MSIQLKRNSDYEVVLQETIEGEPWKQAREAEFQKLRRNLDVKGFRKGKVPERLARQLISSDQINRNALSPAAQKMLTDGIEEYNLVLVEQPTLNILDVSDDGAVIEITCIVEPEVHLGEYKNLDVEKEDDLLTEEEKGIILEQSLQPFSNWLTVEEEAADGDQLLVDFRALDEDGILAGFEGSDAELLLGKRSVYAPVYEQLAGMKAGDEKDITVEVPGKGSYPIHFVVNEVQRLTLPEVTDEFVQANGFGDSAEQFLDMLYTSAQKQKTDHFTNLYLTSLISKIAENTTVEFPQAMIDERINQMLNDYVSQLQQQGVPVKAFIEQIQQNPDAVREQLGEQAVSDLKAEAILEEIARRENLEVEETENPRLRSWQLRQKAVEYLLNSNSESEN